MKRLARGLVDVKISHKDLDDMVSAAVGGVILGGRLGYVLFYNFAFYMREPVEILKIWNGGMSFHGGLVGAGVAIWLFARRRGIAPLALFDLAAAVMPVGLFFGRLANFINGELYGRITMSRIGMVFPNSDGMPRHPSQLYEALGEGILLFVVLMTLWPKMARRRGMTMSAAALGYGIARFCVEFFREPDMQVGYLFGGLTMGQILTLPMIILGGFGLWFFGRRKAEGRFVSSPLLCGAAGVSHKFFTRNGGVSSGVFATMNCKFETSDLSKNVEKNRVLAVEALGATRLATVLQKHTDKVVAIDGAADIAGFLKLEADGIITNRPGLAVGVLTADCVPALVSSSDGEWVGAIHCGWQGIHSGIVAAAVKAFERAGVAAKDLTVALGPSMRQASYEVDEEFARKIGVPALFKKGCGGKLLFDCVAYCRMKFEAEGVKRIEVLPFDTYSQSDLFFSYRRSLVTHDYAGENPLDEGRMLSAIAKDPK
jgi:phosphatidylglycerol:prolipoprotein diacylglycerol transferase